MKGRKKFFKDFYGKTEMITIYELHIFFSVHLILINGEHRLLSILSMMKLFIFTSVNRELTQKSWIGLVINTSSPHILNCMCHGRHLFFENIGLYSERFKMIT